MAGFIPSDNVRRGLSRAQGRDELLLDTGDVGIEDSFGFRLVCIESKTA